MKTGHSFYYLSIKNINKKGWYVTQKPYHPKTKENNHERLLTIGQDTLKERENKFIRSYNERACYLVRPMLSSNCLSFIILPQYFYFVNRFSKYHMLFATTYPTRFYLNF